MQDIASYECFGGKNKFSSAFSIESEKYDALPKDVKDIICYEAQKSIDLIHEKITVEWSKCFMVAERKAHAMGLKSYFLRAGFMVVYSKEIDNEYCGKACCYHRPWLLVTTKNGIIKIGWRKSVINIDWSELDVEVDGNELFKDEDTTKGMNFIHCWDGDKAIEYLTKIRKKIDEIL